MTEKFIPQMDTRIVQLYENHTQLHGIQGTMLVVWIKQYHSEWGHFDTGGLQETWGKYIGKTYNIIYLFSCVSGRINNYIKMF